MADGGGGLNLRAFAAGSAPGATDAWIFRDELPRPSASTPTDAGLAGGGGVVHLVRAVPDPPFTADPRVLVYGGRWADVLPRTDATPAEMANAAERLVLVTAAAYAALTRSPARAAALAAVGTLAVSVAAWAWGVGGTGGDAGEVSGPAPQPEPAAAPEFAAAAPPRPATQAVDPARRAVTDFIAGPNVPLGGRGVIGRR